MTQVKQTGRAAGSLFEVSGLQSLSDEGCNLLLVSDRTLYLLERFARNEVNWEARYIDQLVGSDGYIPVTEASPDFDFVKNVARIFRLEMTDMSCEIVAAINGVAAALTQAQASSCGCQIGSDVDGDDGQEGGPLPGPVGGEPYVEADPITDRKCLASNYIHQSVRDVVNELKLNRADQYGFAGLAFVLSLLSTTVGALIAGPFGLLAGAVVGAFLAMATLLFKASFSLTLLEDAILADEAGAICTLYDATSASGARTAYTAHLSAEGATSLEIEFVEYLLTNNQLNLLFFGWGDSEDVIADVTPTHVCSSCPSEYGCPWEFAPWEGGVAGSGDVTKDGSTRTLSSRFAAGLHNLVVQMETTSGPPPGLDCDGEHTVNSKFELVSYSVPGAEFTTRNYAYWDGDQYTVGPNFPIVPDTTVYEGLYFQFTSVTSAFTVDIKLLPGNFH